MTGGWFGMRPVPGGVSTADDTAAARSASSTGGRGRVTATHSSNSAHKMPGRNR